MTVTTTKEKARTFPSVPRLAAPLFYYYLIFVFHFRGIGYGIAQRRSACLYNLVFNRLGVTGNQPALLR